MHRILPSAAVFIASLIATTFLCATLWEVVVHANLYDCTDPGFVDYLSPGDWVHVSGGQPVAVVDEVVHARSMSEPDTIKRGWSVAGLWYLWFSFVFTSLLISLLLAFLPWLARRRTDRRSSNT